MFDYKFLKLYVKNFLSIGEITFLFIPGYYKVRGVNKYDPGQDDNGSGKTALFVDALIYALTGKTSKGLSGSDVFNENMKSGDSCIVELSFIFEKKEYLIRWENSGLVISSDEDSEDAVKTTGIRNAKTILAEKFKLDYDVLMSTMFATNQSEFNFSSRSPSGRKEFIETMADNIYVETLKSKLGKYLDFLVGRCNRVSNVIANIEGKVGGLEDVINDFSESMNIVEITDQVAKNKKEKDELDSLKLSDEVTTINDSKEDTSDILVAKNRKSSKTDVEITSIEKDLEFLNQSICPVDHKPCKRPFEDPERKKELEDELEKKVSFKALVDQDIKDAEQKITEFNEKVIDINLQLERINTLVGLIDESGLKLKEYNKLTEYKDQVSLYQKKIERLKAYLDEKLSLKDLANQLKTLLSRDIRGLVLEDYLHNLEIELSRLASYLDKDIKLKLNKNKIDIISNGRVYEKLSTGEAKRVDVISQETFKRLHKKQTNYYPYDEVFDGLDITGIKSLVALIDSIHSLASTEVVTTVISHNPAVHDYLESAVPLSVIKEDNGFSTLVTPH